jgi:hypothetical protein
MDAAATVRWLVGQYFESIVHCNPLCFLCESPNQWLLAAFGRLRFVSRFVAGTNKQQYHHFTQEFRQQISHAASAEHVPNVAVEVAFTASTSPRAGKMEFFKVRLKILALTVFGAKRHATVQACKANFAICRCHYQPSRL